MNECRLFLTWKVREINSEGVHDQLTPKKCGVEEEGNLYVTCFAFFLYCIDIKDIYKLKRTHTYITECKLNYKGTIRRTKQNKQKLNTNGCDTQQRHKQIYRTSYNLIYNTFYTISAVFATKKARKRNITLKCIAFLFTGSLLFSCSLFAKHK